MPNTNIAAYVADLHHARIADEAISATVSLLVRNGTAVALAEQGNTAVIAKLMDIGWAYEEANAFCHQLNAACFGPGYNS